MTAVLWAYRFTGGPHDGMTGSCLSEKPPSIRRLQIPGRDYSGPVARWPALALYELGETNGGELIYDYIGQSEARKKSRRAWSGRGLGGRPSGVPVV